MGWSLRWVTLGLLFSTLMGFPVHFLLAEILVAAGNCLWLRWLIGVCEILRLRIVRVWCREIIYGDELSWEFCAWVNFFILVNSSKSLIFFWSHLEISWPRLSQKRHHVTFWPPAAPLLGHFPRPLEFWNYPRPFPELCSRCLHVKNRGCVDENTRLLINASTLFRFTDSTDYHYNCGAARGARARGRSHGPMPPL